MVFGLGQLTITDTIVVTFSGTGLAPFWLIWYPEYYTVDASENAFCCINRNIFLINHIFSIVLIPDTGDHNVQTRWWRQ